MAMRFGNKSPNNKKIAVIAPTETVNESESRSQVSAIPHDASADEIRDFIARNTDSVLSDKLRGDWLRLLGKNQDWATFLTEYPLLVKSDVSLQCYAIRGRIAQGETLALFAAPQQPYTQALLAAAQTAQTAETPEAAAVAAAVAAEAR